MRCTRWEKHLLSKLNEPSQVMIVDGGIKRLLPETYLHWLVMNVPGDKVDDDYDDHDCNEQ